MFRERRRERERDGEKHQCVVASHAPPELGSGPATQVCVLTGNQPSDVLVCSLTFSPLSHTSLG